MPFWDTCLTALVVGVLGLDRLAFGQFMISQPIVTAPLIGALLGDLRTGFMIGVVLELFWLRGLPVGGHVPRDATLSAALVTGFALLPVQSAETGDPAWFAWAFLYVGILLVPIGWAEQGLRRKNAWLIRRVHDSVEPDRGLAGSVGLGVLLFFLYYFGMTLAILGVSWPVLNRGYSALSPDILQGLRVFFYLLPLVGVASLLSYKDLTKGRIHLMTGGAASLLLFVIFVKQNVWALSAVFLPAFILTWLHERRHTASS